MKVAIYQPWLIAKGGAERLLLELMLRSGHQITLFTHLYDEANTFEEYRRLGVVRLSNSYKYTERAVWRRLELSFRDLLSKIDLSGYDVLVISLAITGELIAIRNHSIPVVCYCHRLFNDEEIIKYYSRTTHKTALKKFALSVSTSLYEMFAKRAWKHFDLVLANSNHVRDSILKTKLSEEVFALHPGVDTTKFVPNWNYDNYFLAPGRIHPIKRQDLSIRSFKIFSENNSKFKLIIAGHFADAHRKYFQYLHELSRGRDDIVFLPSLSDEEMRDLYRNAYAVLFSGINESWGLVPVEAMAVGKPVISVNEGGPKESVIDGKTGFLVNAEPYAFAEKMRLLADHPNLVRKMGLYARERALEYDWRNFVRKFDSYIEELPRLRGARIQNACSVQ